MTENGSRGARRCLFGREDPETLSRELTEQVRREERASEKDFEKRWNFRIRDETPLQGRYEWEVINNTQPATSSSRSLSSLPSSPMTDKPVNLVAKVSSDESSDKEKSSSDEKSTFSSSLSSISGQSDATEESEEKDINQNPVKEPAKRKAPELFEEAKKAKRTEPP